MNRRYAAGILALAFAGCSSSAGIVPASLMPQDAGRSVTATHTTLQFVIRVPRRHRHGLVPRYISAGTQSMIVSVQPAGGTAVKGFVNITPSSSQCSAAPLETLTCTLKLVVKSGTYTVTVSTYDALQTSASAPPAGHLLSTNSVAANVKRGKANSIALTLDAIPVSISLAPSSGQPNLVEDGTGGLRALGGTSSTLLLSAYDADGYAIVGPGSPVLTLAAQAASGGIAVAPATNGNPNAFTLSSTGLGNALLLAAATPASGTAVSSDVVVSSTFTTSFLAGQVGVSGHGDGTGSGATFSNPAGLAYDPDNGDLYVNDYNNCTIRQITSGGVVTTIAGTVGSCNSTGDDLNLPIGLAYGGGGYLYVADYGNCTIDQVPITTGTFARIAGTAGSCNSTGSDLDDPWGIVYAGGGTLYFTDSANCVVRKITGLPGAHVMSTFAGSEGSCTDTSSDLSDPTGITYDGSSTLYTTDDSCVVRKIVISGPTISTLAGQTCGFSDGSGTSAEFQSILDDITYNSSDQTLYVADYNNCAIRRVTTAGEVKTLFGNPYGCTYQEGTLILPALTNYVQNVTFAPGSAGTPGTVYFTDSGDHVVRQMNL